jgi:hypothetical protein
MNRFASLLSDVSARLTLPEPARSRILLELSADMEDLHQACLARGFSSEAAMDAVVEQFDLSEEVLRELTRVHTSPLQRSLENLSGQARRAWARALLAFLALLSAVAAGRLLLQDQLLQDASGLVWILLPLLATGLVIGVWKAFSLYLGGGNWSPDRKKGLGYLLGLSALQVILAFSGLWIELYRAALRISDFPREALVHLAHWLHAASATLVVALTGAVILGFFWFFLETRAQQLEEAAVARLLEVAP